MGVRSVATILIDGSNVLFWRGGHAQRDVPMLVVDALRARRFTPIVYFDRSIHRHLGEFDISSLMKISQVTIAPSGTSADTLLLGASEQGRIQIVSCDRFQAWRNDFSHLRRDCLVTGRIGKGGRVSFSKTLRAAPL